MEDEVEGVGDAGCPWKTRWRVWGMRVVRRRRGGGCGGCGLSVGDKVEGVGDAGCLWETRWRGGCVLFVGTGHATSGFDATRGVNDSVAGA